MTEPKCSSFFFCRQKTAYELRISDRSSDVCSSDLPFTRRFRVAPRRRYTAAMNTTRLSLLTIAAALALAGCGNKGPLVLPDAPDEAEAPVAADEANEAVDESADDPDPAAEPLADPDPPVEPEPLSTEERTGRNKGA